MEEYNEEDILGAYDYKLFEKEIEQDKIKRAKKEGMAQGLEQGINQEKIGIAKKLIKENISINIISNVTGMSVEKIRKLELDRI